MTLSDPLEGCWWPPTFGDQKVKDWITQIEFLLVGLTSTAPQKKDSMSPQIYLPINSNFPALGLSRFSIHQFSPGSPKPLFCQLLGTVVGLFRRRFWGLDSWSTWSRHKLTTPQKSNMSPYQKWPCWNGVTFSKAHHFRALQPLGVSPLLKGVIFFFLEDGTPLCKWLVKGVTCPFELD